MKSAKQASSFQTTNFSVYQMDLADACDAKLADHFCTLETKSGPFPTSPVIRQKGRKMVVGTVADQFSTLPKTCFVLDFAACRFSFVLIFRLR